MAGIVGAGMEANSKPAVGGGATGEGLERVSSPDGRAEAVVIAQDAGATTSEITSVFLVAPASKVTDGDRRNSRPVFSADQLEDFRLEWSEIRLLRISYKNARIMHFQNFWLHPAIEEYEYIVRIEEKRVLEDGEGVKQ